ncbi:MAG: M28 family peptidase, partial [Thermoleophilia bacterium]|nr:M28 family peptidase [Thermoleophilia bacterium]
LLQRGACTFRTKVENARAAGASAAIVFNEGNPGRRELFRGTLGPPQVRIPALSASFAVGDWLRNGVLDGPSGLAATVAVDVVAERRRTANVIADSPTGDPRTIVVVGAHLDGVEEGPGLNDNGSGAALVLAVAEGLADRRPRHRLRFAWWGAEELGLFGSRSYVRRLSAAERRRHVLYLNFDMVGSPNFAIFVYDGDRSTGRGLALPRGSAAIERVFARSFSSRGLAHRETSLGASSDHVPFARAGIPVGGLFTGASGRKTEAEAALFGGRAGEPYDPCYHRSCDTLRNVSGVALLRTTRAAAWAVELFARDVSSVRRAR